jgi:hypothetical protein
VTDDQLLAACRAADATGDPEAVEAAYARLAHQRVSAARMRREFSYQDSGPEVVTGGRATGKTHALVEWVKAGRRSGQTTRQIVVLDIAMGRELITGHGLHPSEVISMRQATNSRGGRHTVKEWAVDDTADMLTWLLGYRTRPTMITVLTGETA